MKLCQNLDSVSNAATYETTEGFDVVKTVVDVAVQGAHVSNTISELLVLGHAKTIGVGFGARR